MKLCIGFIVVFGAVINLANGQDEYYGSMEDTCSRTGGWCILKSECESPPQNLGLCPKQQEQGFECCYGVPKSENRCRKFGGQCFNKADCKRPETRATDCGPLKSCCVLIN